MEEKNWKVFRVTKHISDIHIVEEVEIFVLEMFYE